LTLIKENINKTLSMVFIYFCKQN